MKTLDEILTEGIHDNDWTYCKPEYAPNANCKVGMPTEYTPDGTRKQDVKTCYILTGKFCDGDVLTNPDFMFLDDGRFYWYDNLWDDTDVVDQEKSCGYFVEPIAWIAYRNVPESKLSFPNAPCNAGAVPTPPKPEDR